MYEADNEFNGLRDRMLAKIAAVTADDRYDMVTGDDPNYYGVSLNLEGETTVCIYLNQKPVSASIGGNALDIIRKSNHDAFGLGNIASGRLSTMYNVDVKYEGDDSEYTYQISALSYCNRVIRKNTDEIQVNLTKAMYEYSKAANAYFGTGD